MLTVDLHKMPVWGPYLGPNRTDKGHYVVYTLGIAEGTDQGQKSMNK